MTRSEGGFTVSSMIMVPAGKSNVPNISSSLRRLKLMLGLSTCSISSDKVMAFNKSLTELVTSDLSASGSAIRLVN